VVRTTSTATWLPLACSKARSFASSDATWSGVSVPVTSVTGEVSGGTGTSCCACAGAQTSRSAAAKIAAACALSRPNAGAITSLGATPLAVGAALDQFVPGAGAGVVKSTVGGRAIAASFSTVKFGLTL